MCEGRSESIEVYESVKRTALACGKRRGCVKRGYDVMKLYICKCEKDGFFVKRDEGKGRS